MTRHPYVVLFISSVSCGVGRLWKTQSAAVGGFWRNFRAAIARQDSVFLGSWSVLGVPPFPEAGLG